MLERVRSGERFIVCRHGTPVATLQPIDGWCGDIEGRNECDIYGSPLGDPVHEVGKLSDVQRELLVRSLRNGRYLYGGQQGYREAMQDLVLRGLARKSSHRGMVLTGRGIVLKEWLLKRPGGSSEIRSVH